MKATTITGMVAGGVVGLALGAGLLMAPQGKHVKRALEKGAANMRRGFAGMMK